MGLMVKREGEESRREEKRWRGENLKVRILSKLVHVEGKP
jgi:hypothetical protein